MLDCDHAWIENSALRLLVKSKYDEFANIVPMAPTTLPVAFCSLCGALKLPEAVLTALREPKA